VRYSYLDCLFRYHSRDGPSRVELAVACEGCCLEAHLATRRRYPPGLLIVIAFLLLAVERAERIRESDAIHLESEQ
jgi:hypothetical protein